MNQEEKRTLIDIAIQASIDAGEKILEIYNSDFDVEYKDDTSPLTLADQRSHEHIVQKLESTGLPILSEEGASIPYEERAQWEYSWLIDPLDGTKEFIKRNGEFTVNIALLHGQEAIGGIIYVPVKKWLYTGLQDEGAFKMEDCPSSGIDLETLKQNGVQLPKAQPSRNYRVVGSRSHMSSETETFIEDLKAKHGEIEVVSMGSSLKICLVAEGEADVYPRFAPTMEWDTAAGQAIAQAAGKTVLDTKTNAPMKYNRKELLNNWFIVK